MPNVDSFTINILNYSFNVGSKTSRVQSPSRLNPKTATIIANPGNVPSHQALFKYSLPSANIDPQVGILGGIPRPKKLKPDSKTMTNPRSRVAKTIVVDKILGKICYIIILKLDPPSA